MTLWLWLYQRCVSGGAPWRIILQADGEELSYATHDHHTADRQVDQPTLERQESAAVPKRRCHSAMLLRGQATLR